MVIIRLQRAGAKKRPFYHVVVADSRRALCGKYLEEIGFYNPIATGGEVKLNLNLEKIQAWQSKGAQLTPRMAKLVKDYQKQSAEAAA